jgi:hypothetical protein
MLHSLYLAKNPFVVNTDFGTTQSTIIVRPSRGFPLQLKIALAALFFLTNWIHPQLTSFPSFL